MGGAYRSAHRVCCQGVNRMTKFCNILRIAVKALICVLFVACVSVTFAGVFARYVLNDSIIWAEEFSRYTFNWVIMLACALAVSSNSHMYIDVIYRVVPRRFHKAYQAVVDGLVLVFLAFMVYQSVALVQGAGVQISAAMRIPMRWIYYGMPVGFALMLVFGVERLVNDIAGRTEDVLDKYDIEVDRNPEDGGLLL